MSTKLSFPVLSAAALGLLFVPGCLDDAVEETEDLTFRAACGASVAGVASASGHWGDFSPELAVDGDPDSVWVSDQSDGAWLQLDLGKIQKIDGVRVQWRWDFDFGDTATSAIETSVDGATWTQVATTVRDRQSCIDGDAACTEPELLKFWPTSARYLRFRALAWNLGWGQVNELEALVACTNPCLPGFCGPDVYVLSDNQRRAVIVGPPDEPIRLPAASAKQLCGKWGQPLIEPGTLLLAGPRPEIVAEVAEFDPVAWNNPFGFARELAQIECGDPVLLHTKETSLDDPRYTRLAGPIQVDAGWIAQRPSGGPDPLMPSGTYIEIGDDAEPVATDLVDIGAPPTFDRPLMPPILPPVPLQTGLNPCKTPAPLDPEGLADPKPPQGFLPPRQWVVSPKLIQGDQELAAEAKIEIDSDAKFLIEPCIDIKIDPVHGSTGHLGFNVRWAGKITGKYEGKGVYKRKFELAPKALDDDFVGLSNGANLLTRKGLLGVWVIWVPTPAGVPVPVVVSVYPVLELELSVGGAAEFETKLVAKGVNFAGLRLEQGKTPNQTKVVPYYGGTKETDVKTEDLKPELKALYEVRGNLKLEVKASLLDSVDAKAAVMAYAAAETSTGDPCPKCKLEVGLEGLVALGGHLPFNLVKDLAWEVEWLLWKHNAEWEHPGPCKLGPVMEVPPLKPSSGVYEPKEKTPFAAPKRCPFPGFMIWGPRDVVGETTCTYDGGFGGNGSARRGDLWTDEPGKRLITYDKKTHPDLEWMLVEVWMQNMAPADIWMAGKNVLSMQPNRGVSPATACTPWAQLNQTLGWDPCQGEPATDDPGLNFTTDAPHKPVVKWMRVPSAANGVASVDYFGDFINWWASAYNVRAIGVKWANGDVQIAEKRKYCEGQTPPELPPTP